MNRRRFLQSATALLLGARTSRRLSAQARVPMPDVLVLLPGIMGSVLQKDGRDVWALSGGAILRGLRTIGGSVGTLKVAGDDPAVDDLGDGVTTSRLIAGTHLLPGFWKIDGYAELSAYTRRTFDVIPGENFFEFPYDWRRDNRATARKLARASHDWLKSWRARSGNPNARLIFIAHSMGGLVARYFIECLDGWRVTRRLVTFGTPYRGSLNALHTLANGVKIGPFFSDGLTELARSFTSIYQLLPRYPCIERPGGSLARIGEMDGIPNVDTARAASALAFHREIDSCVESHARIDEYRQTFRVHPIVGAYQPTSQAARLVAARVEMLDAYPNQNWEGDGTVPEVSAIPVELSDANQEMYVAQRHSSLQNTGAVLDHMTKVLGRDEKSWSYLRRADLDRLPRIGFHMPDAATATDTLVIRVMCSEKGAELTAAVSEADSGRLIARYGLSSKNDGRYELVLKPLPEGVYRLAVSAEAVPVATSDVFIVASSI